MKWVPQVFSAELHTTSMHSWLMDSMLANWSVQIRNAVCKIILIKPWYIRAQKHQRLEQTLEKREGVTLWHRNMANTTSAEWSRSTSSVTVYAWWYVSWLRCDDNGTSVVFLLPNQNPILHTRITLAKLKLRDILQKKLTCATQNCQDLLGNYHRLEEKHDT